MFTQIVDPVGNLGLTCLIALVPVVLLLVLLAVYRVSAWLAVLIGSIVTFVLAAWVWQMPLGTGAQAYVYGSATGVWNVDWITFWGLMLFNTLGISGVFENFRRWLISQGTLDIRVQTMLFAWAFGALLEGLVGFGYPWAVVAPILISLGLTDSRRDPRRGHRRQRAGFLRGAGRADHRHGRGDRVSLAGVVRLGRHGGRRPGAAAAVGADRPRVRQARVQGRLAARRRWIAWLHSR